MPNTHVRTSIKNGCSPHCNRAGRMQSKYAYTNSLAYLGRVSPHRFAENSNASLNLMRDSSELFTSPSAFTKTGIATSGCTSASAASPCTAARKT
ncbi:hypothetical protein PsorP6_005746 [Peronosclerospora sorghi]|uniref:Uncharacterized protein n=1 Tax=Peronosclerospora sorghi TaxID=230839 RepID=A0ACC0W4Y1_9STRA|nr:hypothetical protein PsorP6_005746 [Peronosclerospora sorghi]